jgi:hypothetical protein
MGLALRLLVLRGGGIINDMVWGIVGERNILGLKKVMLNS